MLEVAVAYAMASVPYVLLACGFLGLFLIVARITTKFCAPAVRNS